MVTIDLFKYISVSSSRRRKIKESIGCVAVKINFLTHSMAQGKKQEPLVRNGIPAPSSNIQTAVVEGFTVRGKDVVRPTTHSATLLTRFVSVLNSKRKRLSNCRFTSLPCRRRSL